MWQPAHIVWDAFVGGPCDAPRLIDDKIHAIFVELFNDNLWHGLS